MNRLAIFDCDGTLVDSQHNICAAMDACFAGAGLAPPTRDQTRSVVGLSLPEAMRALVPDAGADFHDALAARYKQAFWELRVQGLDAPAIGELVGSHGLHLHELTLVRSSLEDAFMTLTHDAVEYSGPQGAAA